MIYYQLYEHKGIRFWVKRRHFPPDQMEEVIIQVPKNLAKELEDMAEIFSTSLKRIVSFQVSAAIHSEIKKRFPQ